MYITHVNAYIAVISLDVKNEMLFKKNNNK